jgi:hypothetical protein
MQNRPIEQQGLTETPAMMTVPSPTKTSVAIEAFGWTEVTNSSSGQIALT